jgi:hypothetical protein
VAPGRAVRTCSCSQHAPPRSEERRPTPIVTLGRPWERRPRRMARRPQADSTRTPRTEIDGDAPLAPSRVRLIRPQFYRSLTTGPLAPDVRDALLGLTTVADDEGWLLWSPEELAATIYPYAPPRRRVLGLQRRTARLIAAGLLIVEPCGCAHLPTLKANHAVKSGRQTAPVWSYHIGHSHGRGIPRNDAERSSSSSGLVLDSDSSSSSFSDLPPGPGTCEQCHRPTSVHAPTCALRDREHRAAR